MGHLLERKLILFLFWWGVNGQQLNQQPLDDDDDIRKLTNILKRNGFADEEMDEALRILRPERFAAADAINEKRFRRGASLTESSKEYLQKDDANNSSDSESEILTSTEVVTSGVPPHAAAPVAAHIRVNASVESGEKIGEKTSNDFSILDPSNGLFGGFNNSLGVLGGPKASSTTTSVSTSGRATIGAKSNSCTEAFEERDLCRKVINFINDLTHTIAALFA